MEYKILGRTGLEVSSIAFGTDNFLDPTPEKESTKMLDIAIDAGINLIDTGDVYAGGEAEKMIGRALKKLGRRNEILISTKVDHGMSIPGKSLDEYENIESFFPRFIYPETGEEFYTDPTYYWYRENILDLLKNNKKTFYNCTGGGVLFGENVICTKIDNFLKMNQ